MSRRTVLALLMLAVGFLTAACDSDNHSGPTAVRPSWHGVALPVPPGPAGRIALRDATACAGRWFVVGAVIGADGATRPAAWASEDARTWESMRLDASSYYARRAILLSVACQGTRVAAVGARSGGAHGNPRVTSWYQRPDGVLVDMHADFELYGGPNAIRVGRIAAGPHGWLITGDRASGAAVWDSADARDFQIIDHDPGLSSDAEKKTSALDQVWDGATWTVVGRVETVGRVSPTPAAWTSADGEHWTEQPVPAGTDGFADLERVARDDSGLVALGLRGDRFGLWRRGGSGWATAGSFGRYADQVTTAPRVTGLVTRSGTVVGVVSDGVRYRVWSRPGPGSADAPWRPVVAPAGPVATGDTRLTVAADDDTVLLLSDDGSSAQLWVTPWSAFTG
jgi:hypothetical protein